MAECDSCGSIVHREYKIGINLPAPKHSILYIRAHAVLTIYAPHFISRFYLHFSFSFHFIYLDIASLYFFANFEIKMQKKINLNDQSFCCTNSRYNHAPVALLDEIPIYD